ncbi:formylglycine-generating enzyme family protein [Fischerella sp. JS2]|uniref:formylglycine-generating enzyme family protein n=1 Tax=Fischerella sp. JS2 TaxID=2597771 RepID=UPI0028E52D5A|nr:formylglycine-generating enzyme family protein [Fischerella sp. JS2]
MTSTTRKSSSNQPKSPGRPPTKDMVWIPSGSFQMGSDHHYPEEAPAHRVTVDGFWMDKYTVTNEQFQKFVKATNYVTFAEKAPKAEDYPGADPAMLMPSSIVFQKPLHPVDMQNICNWWQYVAGANWRHPEGPGSSIKGREKHPVVHVAYEDVEAYAKWIGKEIPTEAEWEFAARGGLDGAEYVWGNEFASNGKMMANTWQGEFPVQNLLTDGYERTAPVGSFPPNGYGLYEMAGNVWEWTADWYGDRHLPEACCGSVNPKGGAMEQSYDPNLIEIRIPRKVLKGGSYLCAPNYCLRYRPAARIAQPIDTSTGHVGFRLLVRR